MKTNIDSVYIHIPFCNSICNYCDFCKYFYNEKYLNKYIISLSNEISKEYKNELIDTLYIGGGTPSCLSINELELLFSKVIKKIKLNNNYEFTFECNIEDLTQEKLKYLYKNKVNRLSIGIQSFDNKVLNILGRKKIKVKDVKSKIILANKIGFNNISIDLMYGIPNTKKADIFKSIKILKKLDIKHISAYSLIVEKNTIFCNKKIKNINSDKESNIYYKIINTLRKNGYYQYEISNFSKKGYECKHNIKYWNNDRYYGFGVSAHGYIDNYRYENVKGINSYIKGVYKLNINKLMKKEDRENEIMLNLRKTEGININKYKIKYNINLEKNKSVKELIKQGYLIKNNEYIKINCDYLYVSNSIISKIIF